MHIYIYDMILSRSKTIVAKGLTGGLRKEKGKIIGYEGSA